MKTIGLIGGVSWESSIEYYRIINEAVKEKLGGLHSARCLMYSFEFQEIADRMQAGEWETISVMMQEAAGILKAGGADFLLICSNTLGRSAPEIEENVGIPVHHIADAAARAIRERGLGKIGFIGTKYAMEDDYYKKRLQEGFGLEVVIPEEDERHTINDIIFRELCAGILNPASKEALKGIISRLHTNGAEGIILGCTEIPLLIKQEDVGIPVFDTMTIHARTAVELALS